MTNVAYAFDIAGVLVIVIASIDKRNKILIKLQLLVSRAFEILLVICMAVE